MEKGSGHIRIPEKVLATSPQPYLLLALLSIKALLLRLGTNFEQRSPGMDVLARVWIYLYVNGDLRFAFLGIVHIWTRLHRCRILHQLAKSTCWCVRASFLGAVHPASVNENDAQQSKYCIP